MSGVTKIEWADRIWNPVVGCTPASIGCVNCYAQRMYHRFYQAKRFSEIQLHPERLDDPTRWRDRSRVFVDSMGDLFHKDVPFEFVMQVWNSIIMSPKQTFLILTKRPERMKEFITEYLPSRNYSDNPVENVWLGVSAENQQTADERIPLLLKTPATLRFVSVEPLLGHLDIHEFLFPEKRFLGDARPSLDWVICGGETGPGARELDPEWVRSLRDQCLSAGTPFFFKSWGEYAYEYNGKQWKKKRVGKGRSGAMLDEIEYLQDPVLN